MLPETTEPLRYIENRSFASITEEIAFASSSEAGFTPEESTAIVMELSLELEQYDISQQCVRNPSDNTTLAMVNKPNEKEQSPVLPPNKHMQVPQLRSVQIVRALGRAGIFPVRQNGSSHMVLRGEQTGNVIVPTHRGRDVKPGTLRAIIRQANLTPSSFMELI